MSPEIIDPNQPPIQPPMAPQPPQPPMPGVGEGISGLFKNIVKKVMPKHEEDDNLSDKFTSTEQKSIVERVIMDIEADEIVQKDWIEQRKHSLDMYNAEKPSTLEGMKIRAWQSDRNLGVAPAIADVYQSTLLAECLNPESIHAIATEKNDIDNKDSTERFAKWMIGPNECDMTPEADDYVHTKITQGFSIFEIYRKVWWEWVDRKIPKKNGGFDIKTEKVRFEKGVIENINNLDDILMPRYGSSIQKLPHIIRIIHLYGDDILEMGEAKQFQNVTAKLVEQMKLVGKDNKDGIEKLKADDLELNDVVDDEFRALPIDVYKWYGWFTKNGRREKYRFLVHRETKTFLSGKPLRKITKTGKYPFVGGPFDKVPGQIRGKDLMMITEDVVNAINVTFNQKSDFQYVTNCPFGFHKAGEGYLKDEYELEPGMSYPTEGNPNEDIFFPNIQRSMAWAESDLRILFEVLEKRTGAATYFASNNRNQSGTATRDMIVKEKSDTRFGKWVTRISSEFSEAITMLLNIYQENMPKNLGIRVLGEDGKELFKNLSVETIRYNADVRMEEDIIAGSKAYERQVMLWGFQTLSQSPWFDPRLNPKGSWLLTSDVMKSQGFPAPDRYLPPQPKPAMGEGREVENVWARLMQGEAVEPEPSWNLPEMMAGLYKKREEKFYDLDPEYRPNFEMLLFKLEIAYKLFVKKMMEEQMANQLAQDAIARGHVTTPGGTPLSGPPGMPAMPQGGPGLPPGAPAEAPNPMTGV